MIIFGIIWATLGLIGFVFVLRMDSANGYTPRKREYIYLMPAWVLIGPLGLYGLWATEGYLWEFSDEEENE